MRFSAKICDRVARICAVLALACAGACVRDLGPVEPDDAASASLRLSTRAGGTYDDYDGDPSANPFAESREDAIDRVDLFFFETSESTDAPFYTCELTGLKAMTRTDLTVKIPVEMFEPFGGSGDGTVYIYALVNLPKEIAVTVGNSGAVGGKPATLKALQELSVREPGFVRAGGPETFVMRGGAEARLERQGKLMQVYGTILLERLAAKIRLWAAIEPVIYLDEDGKTIYRLENESDEELDRRARPLAKEIWHSVPVDEQDHKTSNTMLYLYNIAMRGCIDASSGGLTDGDYDSVDRRDERADAVRRLVTADLGLVLNEADTDADYPYSHTTAYYSYPNIWDSSVSTGEHQTYVIIALPWKREDLGDGVGELYQPFYYQIPVNALRSASGVEPDRLEANRYYRTKIRLAMLGSKDLGDPLPVDASWEAVDWTTAPVNVHIKDRRYLVVNQKEWVMNNTSTIEIPFSTSHDVEVEACYVNYFRYNDVWGTAEHTLEAHNVNEFNKWLDAADLLPDGREGEGLITADFLTENDPEPEIDPGTYTYTESRLVFGVLVPVYSATSVYTYSTTEKQGEQLYYKKDYFYDAVYARPEWGGNGYKYYVGHEHPKTIRPEFQFCNPDQVPDMEAADKDAWNLYREKYGIDGIYTYEIDREKSVIKFNHPLVQWGEVCQDGETEIVDGDTETVSDVYHLFGVQGHRLPGFYVDKIKRKSKVTPSELRYYAPLLNERTGSLWDEFSRCEIIIKIKHADWKGKDDLYRETIHITQYPGMYVEVSHNYGDVYAGASSRGNQYVLVNGNRTERTGQKNQNQGEDNYGTATEWWETSGWVTYFGKVNNNPNMYVIHTTQLSEENEVLYDLGDPRTLYYNNVLDDDSFKKSGNVDNTATTEEWASVRAASSNSLDNYKITIVSADRVPGGGNGKLAYYYPTDESADAGSKENFIAPTFRIASSFGKVSLMFNMFDNKPARMDPLDETSRKDARRRCAAYQEAGRPAGRWRVPTLAEIKYMVQLSAEEKIPHLFGLQDYPDIYTPYWSSSGLLGVRLRDKDIKILDIKSLDDAPAVRCIYDEWYWTKIDEQYDYEPDPVETTFYWGDRPKDNTQVQSLIENAGKRQIIEK